MNKKDAQVVIRRVKKVQGGGHHGGAWKVAYADFVTAMMAFFLVMWLVGSTTNKEKAAISEYFKNPSAVRGHSVAPASGPNGPGGASTSMIKLGGAMEIPHSLQQPLPSGIRSNGALEEKKAVENPGKPDDEALSRELEKRKLESLMDELKAAIEKSQALEPFKDQLLLDITPLGLRIQIVDKQNRPMFDIGSAALKPYTEQILRELSKYLNEVPNKVSISGHTDITPYVSKDGYSNWELSTDRANSARRALIAGGMDEGRVALVVGLASAALFDKQNPTNPINRRISIVIMNKDAERAELGEESRPLPGTEPPAAPAAATQGAADSPPQANPAASAPPPEATPIASVAPQAQSPRPGPTPAPTPDPGTVTANGTPAASESTGPPIHPIVPIPSLAAAAAARTAEAKAKADAQAATAPAVKPKH